MMTSEKSPISFNVDIRRLPQKGFPLVIEPTEAELAALAKQHGLISIPSFRAELLVRDWKKSGVSVTGRVVAGIVQECIVSLDPIAADIDEVIDAVFVPEGSALARPDFVDGEMFLDADGPDVPETFNGNNLDVGALADEFFALGIDPFPRKPDAELAASAEFSEESSPFAKLRDSLQKR